MFESFSIRKLLKLRIASILVSIIFLQHIEVHKLLFFKTIISFTFSLFLNKFLSCFGANVQGGFLFLPEWRKITEFRTYLRKKKNCPELATTLLKHLDSANFWGWQALDFVILEQSCRQIEIYPEFGSFSGAFLDTYDKNGKVLFYF